MPEPTEGQGERFRLSMRGTGVSLSKLPAREWMEVLDSLLAGVEAEAATQGAKSKGRFAITGLHEGSVEPILAALDEEASPGLRSLVKKIQAGRADILEPSAREAAETLARFAERYEGELAIFDFSSATPLAILDARVRPRVRTYKELAVVYGWPFRVGGKQEVEAATVNAAQIAPIG